MNHRRASFIVALLLVVGSLPALSQERRVALVVGNANYQRAPRLPNAANDADAMADLLRKAGFHVVIGRSDLGNAAFKKAVREFGDAAEGSEIAVAFYAGHGVQIRSTPYLIPVDADIRGERDAARQAIALDDVITAAQPATRLRLVILGTSRDNRLIGRERTQRRQTRGSDAPPVPEDLVDTLVAYATRDGSAADDGDGEHSPYAAALLRHLTVPGLDIRLAFGLVRDEVLRTTNRRQEPYVYGSLGGGIVALVPARAGPAVPGRQSPDDAMRQDPAAPGR